MTTTVRHPLAVLPLLPVLTALAGLVLAGGCGSSAGGPDQEESGVSSSRGGAQPDGYAEQVSTETDDLAARLLPALASTLGAQVTPGLAGFLECDVSGWRYTADVDVFLPEGADQAVVPDQVASVMQGLDLEVEQRDDDTVVGRRGELSALLGQAAGPPARPFRHLSLTHACADYSDADTEVAGSAQRRDYASLLPPDAVYSPAG